MIDTKSNLESANIQRRFYADNNSLSNLSAKSNDIESLKAVAKEFEAIFLQMAMKSMRDTVKSMKSELTTDSATETYQEMYDSQLAMHLSGASSLGIADAIVRQFSQNFSVKELESNNDVVKTANTSVPKNIVNNNEIINITNDVEIIGDDKVNSEDADPIEFVKKVWLRIQELAKDIELDPKMILAQAIHETGWGKFIPRFKSGNISNNIFGIKADNSWNGASAVGKTFEVEDGIVKNQKAKFRAYSNLGDGIKDYFSFVRDNPRYEKALAARSGAEYIKELHKAGYATDPNYSDKVMSIYNGDRLNSLIEQLNG